MTGERPERRPRPREGGTVTGLLPTGAHNAITEGSPVIDELLALM